jgi:anti-sigma B factor antagonist
LATNSSNLPTTAEIGIAWENRGGECHVLVSGRIDIDSSPELRSRLFELLQPRQCEELTLDLYRVDYIDTSGLAVLVEVLKAARLQGKRLRLSRLGERPRYLLESTRMLHLFEESPAGPSASASEEATE